MHFLNSRHLQNGCFPEVSRKAKLALLLLTQQCPASKPLLTEDNIYIFLLCLSFASGASCNPEKAKIQPSVLTPSSQACLAQQSHLELQQSAHVGTTPR